MTQTYKNSGGLSASHNIRLNIDKLAVGTSIPAETLEELKSTLQLDEYLDSSNNILYRRLSALLPTSGIKTLKLPYPDGLWEFIKQEYTPAWFKRKYPVKYSYLTLEARELFPEFAGLVKNGIRYLDIRLYD